MSSTDTATWYVVARETTIIGPKFSLVEDAKAYLDTTNSQLTEYGVTPLAGLNTVTVTTTESDPEPYVEPEPAEADTTVEQTSTLPADEGGPVDDHDTSTSTDTDTTDTAPTA